MKRTFKIGFWLKALIEAVWLKTYRFVFWLGVASFLSGLAFQLFGKVSALEAQTELVGETVPDWISKSYGGEMIFFGAIAIAAAIAGWLLTTRRRRETQLEDFPGRAEHELYDRLRKETDAYIVGKGISNP